MLSRYLLVTETATKPAARWSNHDVAMFHAFNPNGLVASLVKADATLTSFVECGAVTPGYYLAYESGFQMEQFHKLVRKERVSGICLAVAIKMANAQREHLYNKLAAALI